MRRKEDAVKNLAAFHGDEMHMVMNDDDDADAPPTMPVLMPEVVRKLQSRTLRAEDHDTLEEELLEAELAEAIAASIRVPVPRALLKRVLVPVILGRGLSIALWATEWFVCDLPACQLPGPVKVTVRCTGSTKLPDKLVALAHAISLETGRDLFPSYCEAVLGIVTDKGGVLQSILE